MPQSGSRCGDKDSRGYTARENGHSNLESGTTKKAGASLNRSNLILFCPCKRRN